MSAWRKEKPLLPGATTRLPYPISRLSVTRTRSDSRTSRAVSPREIAAPARARSSTIPRARRTPPSVPRWLWRTSRSATPSFSARRAYTPRFFFGRIAGCRRELTAARHAIRRGRVPVLLGKADGEREVHLAVVAQPARAEGGAVDEEDGRAKAGLSRKAKPAPRPAGPVPMMTRSNRSAMGVWAVVPLNPCGRLPSGGLPRESGPDCCP